MSHKTFSQPLEPDGVHSSSLFTRHGAPRGVVRSRAGSVDVVVRAENAYSNKQTSVTPPWGKVAPPNIESRPHIRLLRRTSGSRCLSYGMSVFRGPKRLTCLAIPLPEIEPLAP
eukprot:9485382-Pyramimonas_sp.AAC.1